MNARLIDWIWHIRGSLALAPGQTTDDAFSKLDPLFGESGTRHQRNDDTLTFSKENQSAQDKMSVFDSGVLKVERGVAGSVLRYHLTSRALLFCFFASFLFIGIGQLTIYTGKHEAPIADAAKKKADKQKAADKSADVPMNPIDKALGAPAPDKKKTGDKPGGRNKKPSPTSAYVFAGIFAALYVIGRILEDRLVRRLFKRRLLAA